MMDAPTSMDASIWPDGTIARAWFDPTRVYRYRLEREFPDGVVPLFSIGDGTRMAPLNGSVTFLLLNCSTADALRDDPTVRRCSGFAKRWGFKRLIVVNLFALRSTDPAGLRRVDDPVGLDNDAAIMKAVADSNLTIAAWGIHGSYLDRDKAVMRMLEGRELSCLGTTKDGGPLHPLYLKGESLPIRFGHSNA